MNAQQLVGLEAPPIATESHLSAGAAPLPEPAMVSPPPPSPPTGKTKGSRGKMVIFAVVARLVGVGIGYAAGLPAKSDVAGQRDEAVEQVDQLTADLEAQAATLATAQADLATANTTAANTKADLESMAAEMLSIKATLDTAEADLAAAKADLATAEGTVADVTALREVCEQAAVAGEDLSMQWANYVEDFVTWWFTPTGSAAEAELQVHMTEQLQKMEAQAAELDELLTTCSAG